MRFYILKVIDGQVDWDEDRAVIVRAESGAEARKVAALEARSADKSIWLNNKITTCKSLSLIGKAELILRDNMGS